MKACAYFEQTNRRGRGFRLGPEFGLVMRERILSRVLFPAPLRPMIPTTSPRLTSKETSSRAQKEFSDFGFRISD